MQNIFPAIFFLILELNFAQSDLITLLVNYCSSFGLNCGMTIIYRLFCQLLFCEINPQVNTRKKTNYTGDSADITVHIFKNSRLNIFVSF